MGIERWDLAGARAGTGHGGMGGMDSGSDYDWRGFVLYEKGKDRKRTRKDGRHERLMSGRV